MPRPDFPRSVLEFQRRFSLESACWEYLTRCRWPDGFACSRCKNPEAYDLAPRKLRQCKRCGYQVSVTAGTVLHRTRQPLTTWFWAAYLVVTHTPGISALQFQRQVDLSRYETAWVMLQKLRRAMIRPERDRIRGVVEVDETYLGGLDAHLKGGRQKGTKAIVVAAVEVRGKGSGRVRMGVVPDVTRKSLSEFVASAVEPGSTVRTDGWHAYEVLPKAGYVHEPTIQGARENAAVIFPRVHRVFSNLKSWLIGTHHGVEHKHLPHYLNEFVFRFNRRRSPMAAFQSLLGLTALCQPTSYKQLYASESTG